MFLGTYEHKLDPRGRISVPARFREDLAQGMVLSQGFDPCINLYPLKIWQEMAEKHAAPLIAQEKLRRISRFIFSPAFTEELDKLGRILLPAPLRQYARITDAVIIAGVNTYIEIWGKENWDREKVATDEQGWQIAEGLERRE